ncbi:MAG: hypothetical protein AB1752_06480 [Candidatus Zixiibacteriota bacterium]
MKARDILILIVLVLMVLGLTAIEKYSEHQRDARQREEIARQQRDWQARMTTQFESRWNDLSAGLRHALDSIATSVIDGGVTPESLAVVVVDSTPVTPILSDPPVAKSKPMGDTLALQVAHEYKAALATLPGDLNAYESRIASGEVASLIRAKHGLTEIQFDSLLKAAGRQETAKAE